MVPDPSRPPEADISASLAPEATLSPEERKRVLFEWNRTEAPFPRSDCLQDGFERQAAAKPEAIAVVVGTEHLSYRELNQRANRIAHVLRSRGVGAETLVGIFLTRSADLVAALLGVLKAGGAYVPMDPSYPKDRLAFMLKDACVHTVLTEASLAGNLRNLGAANTIAPGIVLLDTDEDLRSCSQKNPAPVAAPRNLAYVIYTSGSTGRPKGVGLEHRNAVAFVHWAGALYSPRELNGVLAATSICFDPSILELFVPLSHGGKVILAENALALPSLPAAHEIHLMDTVPSAMRELLRTGGLPRSLETVNLGGEPVSDDLVRQLYALPHIKRVYDQFGPTETTTTATCALREPEEPGTIGRPIANTQVYLLNEQREPVAPGASGELYIGGAGVARGYLNRPELTAEKFIPDPFSPKPGARIYRTGDLCRYRPDGRLEYIGRLDQQVKINGRRVELGEIEAVLRSHPAVEEAVAVMREDKPGHPRLTAYVVLRGTSTRSCERAAASSEFPEASGLRAHLKARVPQHMVPAVFVALAHFPLMATGKIDRKALPAPPKPGPGKAGADRAPRTLNEEKLCALWAELLGLEQVRVHDNFFDIGGDSLTGVAMLGRVEKISGRKLPHDTILKAPTVAGLAALLDGGRPSDDPVSLVGVQTHGSRPRLYLVHGIGGGMLWGYGNLSRHLGPDQPVYVFTAPELETNRPSPTISAMAARYVEELRGFQPEGPYLLGGYCFGGNVAYEMARILREQCQAVELLALFNCWPSHSSYDHFRATPVQLFKFARNLGFWAGRFLSWDTGTRRDFLQWKLRAWTRKLAARFLIHPGHESRNVDAQINLSGMSPGQQRLWSEHALAIGAHQTGPYDGVVTLFRTRSHPLFCSFDHQCGWGELAQGGVKVRIIPGQHETIMTEPHVGLLAQALKSDLATVTRRRCALLVTLILSVSPFCKPAAEKPAMAEDPFLHTTSAEIEIVPNRRSRAPTRAVTRANLLLP